MAGSCAYSWVRRAFDLAYTRQTRALSDNRYMPLNDRSELNLTQVVIFGLNGSGQVIFARQHHLRNIFGLAKNRVHFVAVDRDPQNAPRISPPTGGAWGQCSSCLAIPRCDGTTCACSIPHTYSIYRVCAHVLFC
ncbi:hypothetical protein FRC12_018684 [Ceratobasidium sp. 428]|nr:hypothetical protein FRC12_018684 [Ceratobasidium sp. 428]